jgi:predicted nucleic acid-binding protein
MLKPLIFNSSPLIYLTKASLTKLLKEIPETKFTTTKVFNEIVQEGKKKGAPEASLLESMFKQEIIKLCNPKDEENLKSVKKMSAETERQPLHEAEAEVLCLAKELNGIAIADDQVARSVAKLLEIELHGTGYILGKIFATDKIKKEELVEKVKQMRDEGWHVSAEDYTKIIEYLKSL